LASVGFFENYGVVALDPAAHQLSHSQLKHRLLRKSGGHRYERYGRYLAASFVGPFNLLLAFQLPSPGKLVTIYPPPAFFRIASGANSKYQGLDMEVTVGGTADTSANICDMCSRINIESLSPPEGYPHFYKQSNMRSCILCFILFCGLPSMADQPVRIKLSRKPSSMGFATLYLSVVSGTDSVRSSIVVITKEGRSL
jgi:hypothetical protein